MEAEAVSPEADLFQCKNKSVNQLGVCAQAPMICCPRLRWPLSQTIQRPWYGLISVMQRH